MFDPLIKMRFLVVSLKDPMGENFQDYSLIQYFEAIESQPQNTELGRI